MAKTMSKPLRFFRIAQSLPMELQMLVCNRVVGSEEDSLRNKVVEQKFREIKEKPDYFPFYSCN
jgi:hypothetical protein